MVERYQWQLQLFTKKNVKKSNILTSRLPSFCITCWNLPSWTKTWLIFKYAIWNRQREIEKETVRPLSYLHYMQRTSSFIIRLPSTARQMDIENLFSKLVFPHRNITQSVINWALWSSSSIYFFSVYLHYELHSFILIAFYFNLLYFQLIFEGIRGSSYTGDAAIDNVVLKECGGGGGGGEGCGKFLKMPLSITKNDKWTEH